MGKLEDIPKKQFFKVPDGYFDKLPTQIQSRISNPGTVSGMQPVFRYALQYALPLVVVAAILFYNYSPRPDAESMLVSVETTDLIQYLQESDMTTEDLLDQIDFSGDELEAIENEVYDMDIMDIEDESLNPELITL